MKETSTLVMASLKTKNLSYVSSLKEHKKGGDDDDMVRKKLKIF